jgi:hypothetical protein
LLLLPLAAGWGWRRLDPVSFGANRETVLIVFLGYIAIVRLLLLDLMLYYISRRRRSVNLDLLHIVLMYLEVSVITVLYFALLFQLMDVFTLFRYSGTMPLAQVQSLEVHPLSVALYISVELFTTLGLGDWVPQTLNAMWATGIEALLGFVQGGVFFAVLIYAHQTVRDES